MPEEIAAAPGWADERLTEVFAVLPDTPAVAAARGAYASCMAAAKSPSAPSDLLGAEFAPCRAELRMALQAAGMDAAWSKLEPGLEALEAEIASDS